MHMQGVNKLQKEKQRYLFLSQDPYSSIVAERILCTKRLFSTRSPLRSKSSLVESDPIVSETMENFKRFEQGISKV